MEEEGTPFGELKKSTSLTSITHRSTSSSTDSIFASSKDEDDDFDDELAKQDNEFYSPRLKKAISLNFGHTEGLDLSHIDLDKVISKKPLHKRSIFSPNKDVDPTPVSPPISPPTLSTSAASPLKLTKGPPSTERGLTLRGDKTNRIDATLTDLTGQVLLKLVSAKDLCKKGTCSAYCELSIGVRVARSGVIYKQQSPVWNETINLFVESADSEVVVEVMNDDVVGKEKRKIGSCTISLSKLSSTPTEQNVTLHGGTAPTEASIRVIALYRILRDSGATDKDIYGFKINGLEGIAGGSVGYWEYVKSYYKKVEERRREWNKSGWFKAKDFPKEFRSWGRKFGFPLEHRGELWQIISGSKSKLKSNSDYYFITLDQHKSDQTIHSAQIDKDLDRTFPHNLLFKTAEGKEALRRVLRAFSWKNQSIGYCQSMNFICGLLLLLMDEEAVFWCLATITEDLVPDYFNMNMMGAKADVTVFKEIASKAIPKIMSHFELLDFDISIVSTQWFLCLYAAHLPTETLMRVFDVFLMEGSRVLHQVGIGLLKMNEAAILECNDFEECYTLTKAIASRAFDSDKLMRVALKEITVPPNSKIKSIRLVHQKRFEDTKRQNVFQELLSQTSYTEKELESLSRQFNSMVQITPDNQNLLMNCETFIQVIISLRSKDFQHNDETEEETTLLLSYVFKALDANADGNIDFKEFILAMHTLRRGTHTQKLRLAFLVFDENKIGFLTTKEVTRMIETMERTIPLGDDIKQQIYETLLPDVERGGKDRVDENEFKESVVTIPLLESWLLDLVTMPE